MENKFFGKNHQSPEQNQVQQAQQVEQYFNNQEQENQQNTQPQPNNNLNKDQNTQIQALPKDNNQKVELNTANNQFQAVTENQKDPNNSSDDIIKIKEQISANPNGEGLHNAIDFANSANLQSQSEINNPDQNNKAA